MTSQQLSPQNHPLPPLFTRDYLAMVAANFMLYFGFWLLIPLLPFYLKETFDQNEASIGVILSLYTLAALAVRPFAAFLLDSFNRRWLWLVTYGLFTLAFLGYPLCGALVVFVGLRVMHGLAFGAVTVGGNTVVVDIMPSARRGEGLGYYGLANNLAMSLGPMTGLLLHGRVSYDVIFFTAATASSIGLALALGVKAPSGPMARQGALSLDRFFLPKGIWAGLSLMLLSVPYGATTNYVSVYVAQAGVAVQPGLFFVLLALGMGASRIVAGRYVDRGLLIRCIAVGFYLVVAAFVLLGLCGPLASSHKEWAVAAFVAAGALQGVGFGMMFPAFNTLFVRLAPHNRRATAVGTYLTSWDVGIGIGIAAAGAVAHGSSFSTVYLCGGIMALVSMAVFLGIAAPHFRKNALDD